MSAEDAVWDISSPDFAWRVWRLMDGLDWKFLPYAGGLLEQPDDIIQMLLTVSWRKAVLENLLKNGSAPVSSGATKTRGG